MGTVSPSFTCCFRSSNIVIAARLEGERLPGGNLDAGDLPHLHHAVVHRHFMNLDDAGDRRFAGDQPHALVGLQLHEGTGGLLLRHRSANPRLGDGDLGARKRSGRGDGGR